MMYVPGQNSTESSRSKRTLLDISALTDTMHNHALHMRTLSTTITERIYNSSDIIRSSLTGTGTNRNFITVQRHIHGSITVRFPGKKPN